MNQGESNAGVLSFFTKVPLTQFFFVFRHSLQKMNRGEGDTVSCVNGAEALVGI